MKLKKILSGCLAAVMLVSTVTVASAASVKKEAKEFPDFDEDAWYAEAVSAAVDNDLLRGTNKGKLNPQGNLTRAEMAAIANRAFGTYVKANITKFKDVSKNAWYYEDIQMAYGSIEEVSLGTTRGDLIRSLYEGLAYEIRLNLEYAKRGGAKLQKLIVFGGASKSCVLCQIIADVTKLHVYATANGELGSIGAAKLAIQGLGLDAEQFARAAIGEKIQYIPIEANVAQYDSLYQTYIKKYK